MLIYILGKISITLSGYSCLPKTNSTEDIGAADRAMLFTVSMNYELEIYYFIIKFVKYVEL